ncbi:MAG: AraC family transcriptional regulator [Candidatus Adiutrix sp.]|jgi:AraC family transcriptional regulator|nr:AraC family transcriptional regulator [Candidatus Adiutrix sp.]
MSSGNTYQKRIQRVLRHIEKRAGAMPSLEELAAVAHFSPFHFHRVFKSLVGESVAAYVRRLALQNAAQHLSYYQESVTDIAFDAGYESPEAFTRAFRSAFGVSPSQYRKQGGSPAFAIKAEAAPYHFYHTNPEVYPVKVQVKTVEPALVASLRHIGAYDACEPAWERLCEILRPAGLCQEGATVYGVCYDDPDTTPAEKCRMDVCLTLPKGVDANTPALAGLLQTTELFTQHIGNGGEYACVLIKGPYSLLHPAYRSLFGEWLPQSGREPGDSIGFEAYYNDPAQTPPEELLSEIFIPLKPLR